MQEHEEIKIPAQILWTACMAVNDLVMSFSKEVQMTPRLMCFRVYFHLKLVLY